MNYTEAKHALAEGKKVKLPEWAGYWFIPKEGDAIKVFTATGDVIDTPYLDDYKNRTDWEVTDGSRDFGGAIKALKAGKLVSRAGWNGKNMFLFIRPADILETGFIPKVKSLPDAVKVWIDENIDDKVNQGESGLTPVKFGQYICMKAADNSIVNGWLASQTDMLSEDWIVL